LKASEVEKRELLLFMLALQHLSGGAHVAFTRLPTMRSQLQASGVTATLVSESSGESNLI
jgi:hypothetical protein